MSVHQFLKMNFYLFSIVFFLFTGTICPAQGQAETLGLLRDEQCRFGISGHDEKIRQGFVVVECDPSKFLTCDTAESGLCICANSADPHDQSKCLANPATQNYGQPCHYNLICKHEPYLECPHEDEETDTCGCSKDYPVYESSTGTCRKGTNGDDCVAKEGKAPCETSIGLTCEKGKCECSHKKTWQPAPDNKCKGVGIDGACTVTQECELGLECIESKCGCNHMKIWDATVSACISKPNVTTTHCDSSDTSKSVCDHPSIACLENLCSCPDGSDFNAGRTECVAKVQVSLGGKCTKDIDCLTVHGLICKDNKCSCADQHTWYTGKCTANALLIKCVPGELPSKCDDSFNQNLECDETEHVCKCGKDTIWEDWAKACKLKGGQSCVDQKGKPTHDLCASQHCIETGEEGTVGTCTSSDDSGSGVGQIWSSEKTIGSITDLYLHPCNLALGNAPCNPTNPGFKVEKGLQCVKEATPGQGHCDCGVAFSYSQGYCIKTDVTYGGKCSRYPDGSTDSCEAPETSSLTCKAQEDGSFECECLPKLVSTGSGRAMTELVWEVEAGACLLKPAGDDCKEGYECTSGKCENGKCKAVEVLPGKTKKTGAGGGIRNEALSILGLLAIVNLLTLLN